MGQKNFDEVDGGPSADLNSSTWRSLSVEPAGFLSLLSMITSFLILQNMMMQTICQVDLGYPEDKCTEIINNVNETYKKEEREIQSVSAGLQAVTSVVFISITIVVVLFVGPWSDANGRKGPLLMSQTGLLSLPVLILLCHILRGKLSAIQMSFVIMIPSTVMGGTVVFAMSAYSYIADRTTTENRTLRTGLLTVAMRAGTPLGFALGGVLTRFGVGVVYILLVATALALVALLILTFTVKSIPPARHDESSTPTRTTRNKYNPLTKLVQTLSMLVKKRENRQTFLLLIVCHICSTAPIQGEYTMMYLFVRERLSWGISEYGFFSMTNFIMSGTGVVLSLLIFTKVFKISDPVLGLLGGLSQIGGCTMYAFSSTPLMIYAAAAIDMMNGTLGVVIRSMLSKAVRPEEVGQMYALLGVLESLAPVVMVPVYAMVYQNTATVFAGAFFFLSAGLTLPAEIIFLCFSCKVKTPATDPSLELNGDHGDKVEKIEKDPADTIIES